MMSLPRAAETVGKIRFIFARWVDSFWGYDVFIAHRRADAAEYAQRIYEKLTQEKISCFIDKVVYGAGDSLLVATRRHVTKSTLFFLVGSPALLTPRQPDWVEQEIQTYLTSHETDPKLILVDFGMTVANALAAPAVPGTSAHPILRYVEPFLRIPEDLPDLAQPPSEAVLDAVRRNLSGRRRDRTRLRFFEGAAAVLAALLVMVTALGIANERSRKHAEARRLLVEARTNLASPPATQVAIAQARAALLMEDSIETRDLAREIVDRLMVPTKIVPAAEIGNIALFGAFRSDGRLLIGHVQSGMLLSPQPEGKPWTETALPRREGCEQWFYSSDGEWISCLIGRRLQVWNALTAKTVSDINLSPALFSERAIIALNPDGTHAVVGERGRISSIDIGTGQKREMEVPADGGEPYKIAISPDGRWVALVPSVTTINAKTPVVLIDTHTGTLETVTEQPASIRALAFSTSGGLLAVGAEDGRVEIIAVKSKRLQLQLQSLPGLHAMSFSRDDRFIGIGATNAVSVYDVSNGIELAKASTDGPVYHVSFDATGTHLLTSGAGANLMSARTIIWDLHSSADFSSTLYMPDEEVSTIGFDAHSRLIQSIWSGLRLVDLNKNEVTRLENIPGFDINQIRPDSHHEALLLGRNVFGPEMAVRSLTGSLIGKELEAFAIAATPDASTIAFLSSATRSPDAETRPDSRLTVWRASDPAGRTASVPESASSIALDATARYLTVTFEARPSVPARLAVYAVDNLNKLNSLDATSISIETAIAPDGRTVLVAEGNTLVTRQLPDLKFVRSVTLSGDVKEIAFSDTSGRYAVADASGTVSVFEANGSVLASRRAYFERSQRRGLVFNPNGDLLLVHNSKAGRGTILLISLRHDGLNEQLCMRQLGEPVSSTWRSILPNDSPPRPCPAGWMAAR